MSSQYTPGPWRDFAPKVNGEIKEVYREIAAGCEFFDFEDPSRGFGITGYISPANSRLIAAAPDLLAAAKVADYAFKHGSRWDEAIEALRAAIAKAESKDA